MNHFTETSTTNLGGNLLNSLKGIIFGFALLVGSIYLLLYNEHISINQALALEEIQEKIVIVDTLTYKVEYENVPILIYDNGEKIEMISTVSKTVLELGDKVRLAYKDGKFIEYT